MDKNSFSRCLFCATNLAHFHHAHDESGGVKLVINDKKTPCAPPPPPPHQTNILTFQGDSVIQQELQTFFILHNILKIPKETLCLFLVDNEHSSSGFGGDTDLWRQVQVCPPCGELVFQYYQAEKKPRLETAMKRIGNKLKEKIEESKDVEGPTPGSIWGRIRTHVLKEEEDEDSAPHQVIIKVEIVDKEFEEDDQEGDWNMGDAHIKTEYDDSGSPTNYETHSTSESESWEPHPDPPFNLNLPKAKAKRKRRPRPSNFRYICADCPYKNMNSASKYEAHIQVHFEGSPAIPCPECGVVVFLAKLSEHLRNHRRRESRRMNMQRNPPPPPLPDPELIEPPPKLVTKEGPPYSQIFFNGRKWQICRDCPFKLSGSGGNAIQRIETHILLHKMGSLGVPCPDCGCYQAKDKLFMHRSIRHAMPKGIRKRKKMASSSAVELGKADGTEPDQGFDCFEETIVKTEVVDLGHVTQADYFLPEEEVEESEPIPIYQPPFYLSFIDEEFELEPSSNLKHRRPPKNPAPKKKVSSRRKKPKVSKTRTTSTSSSNPNYTVESRTRMDSSKVFKCVHCPYKCYKIKLGIEAHIKLHEPGSRAIPCPDCGIFVFPERLKSHTSLLHPQVRSRVTRRQMKESQTQKKKVPKTNPNFRRIAGQSGFYKGMTKFACNHCYYRTGSAGNIKTHIELHEEGSTAIPCGICGWFVLPEHMQIHNDYNHNKEEGSSDGRGQRLLLQCAVCPYESKSKTRYEEHQALHLEGSGAKQCTECGCYADPPLSNHRRGQLCAKLRKRKLCVKTVKEAGITQNQNELEENRG